MPPKPAVRSHQISNGDDDNRDGSRGGGSHGDSRNGSHGAHNGGDDGSPCSEPKHQQEPKRHQRPTPKHSEYSFSFHSPLNRTGSAWFILYGSLSCAVRASEKKLAGAALNSFMKKCEREAAQSSCDETAKEKKLSGAARTSFTKKCVRDAAGK